MLLPVCVSSMPTKRVAPVEAAGVAAKAKRGSVESDVVPTVRVSAASASDAATLSPVAPMPQIPDDIAVGTGAREFMQQICPWVLQELPKFVEKEHNIEKASVSLASRAPLAIGGVSVSSYKEPWVPTNCAQALANAGMYEAGANAFWINPDIQSADLVEDPAWAWVLEFSDIGFVPVTLEGIAEDRIRFPIPLEGYWETPVNPGEMYPSGVRLLLGHSHLWALYVAVFRSMKSGDARRVKQLYECALTATLCVRTDCSPASLAIDFLHYGERIREGTKAMVINFITFSQRVTEISQGKPFDLAFLQQKKLRFCGGLVNATMLKTIGNVQTMVDDELRLLFGQLDRRFGRDALTASYNKIRLLLLGCQNKHADARELVKWTVEVIILMLSTGSCTAADLTVTQFQKGRDGSPSLISQAVAQHAVVSHIFNIVANIAKVDSQLSEKIRTSVMEPLRSPLRYLKVFAPSVFRRRGEDGVEGDDQDAEEQPTGSLFMDNLQQSQPKAGVMVADIMVKVYDNTYDVVIMELAKETDAVAKLIMPDGLDLGDLGRDLNEMMRAINAAESVISSTGNAPPRASLRELVRNSSHAEDRDAVETERADIWRQAVAQRKKLVTLGLTKNPKNPTGYAEVFKKAATARAFKGEANSAHRAFVVSADLMHQCGTEPWLEASVPPADVLKAAVDFALMQRDTFDLSLAFDGTMRKSRRVLEDAFDGVTGSAEFVVVYDQAPGAIFQRKNFMSQRNTEAGYIKMPISRAKITVKERADGFGASGETGSNFSSYSGVKMVPRVSLPMIAPAEKIKVFSQATSALPKRWQDRSSGVPMFWLESKSIDFWAQLLEEATVKCVVDMSPGSGALAQACMSKGIHYFGIVSSQGHLSWLSNALDRASLKFVVQTGSYLYQEDLATHISELFSDLIENDDAANDEGVQASDEE